MVTQIPQESVALIARIPQEFEKIMDLITSLAQRVEKLEFQQDEDHDQQEDNELLNILTDRSAAVQSQVDALVETVQQLETNLTLVQAPLRNISIFALPNDKDKDAVESDLDEDESEEMVLGEVSSELETVESGEESENESLESAEEEEESENILRIKETHIGLEVGVDNKVILPAEYDDEISQDESQMHKGSGELEGMQIGMKSEIEMESAPAESETEQESDEESGDTAEPHVQFSKAWLKDEEKDETKMFQSKSSRGSVRKGKSRNLVDND